MIFLQEVGEAIYDGIVALQLSSASALMHPGHLLSSLTVNVLDGYVKRRIRILRRYIAHIHSARASTWRLAERQGTCNTIATLLESAIGLLSGVSIVHIAMTIHGTLTLMDTWRILTTPDHNFPSTLLQRYR